MCALPFPLCLLFSILSFALTGLPVTAGAPGAPADRPLVVVIHGGAGTILKKNMTPEKERAYMEMVERGLRQGYEMLEEGASSIDVVEAVIVTLEDSPLFNAGKGAVFNHEGKHELDASIMEGASLKAGAVASVTRIRNPIKLARLVMSHSPHVFLVGEGAEIFAQSQGMAWVDPSYFFTVRRWEALEKAKKNEKPAGTAPKPPPSPADEKHGTVGVLALDGHGNLAAGTSTGGMTNKRFGRVGDSPVIGAGTYADNRSCAVSATGHGEYFIRAAVAHDIAARVAYMGLSIQAAADKVIREKLVEMGGTGGVIVLDAKGNVAMSFNTPGMYRGYLKTGGEPIVKIYRD